MYGPATRCKRLRQAGRCGLASMYPASDWSVLCSGPSWISARIRTGHPGHRCSHAPGRPILSRRLILSQTSAGMLRSRAMAEAFRNLRAAQRKAAPKGDRFLTRLLLLGLGFLGRHWRFGGLPCQPLGLEPLPVGIKCLLCKFVLSHCLFGIDLAKCLTRRALRVGDRLRWFKLARCLCHFFTLSPGYRRRMACLEPAHDLGVQLEDSMGQLRAVLR